MTASSMTPVEKASITARTRRRSGFLKGHAGAMLVAPVLIMLLGLVVIPVIWEMWHSFMTPSFSLKSYGALVDGNAYVNSMISTLRIAAGVTVICVPLAYALGLALVTIGGRLASVVLAVAILPFWISAVVRSFAWILILQRHGPVNNVLTGSGLLAQPIKLVDTSTAVYIAMASVLMPIMVLPIYNSMREVDADYLKAAASLGASRWHVFKEVFLPLTMPGVAAGGLLVFILSLGYFVTPSLVGGPNDVMVAVLIYQETQAFNWPIAFALSTVLLSVILALYALASVTVGVGRLLVRGHQA